MTETEIANLALSLIAGKALTALDTDPTQQADVCRKWFDAARDEALASHAWNFATKRARLTLDWTAFVGVALAASGAGEIAVNAASHGLSTGQRLHVQDVEGVPAANGTWYVTVIDPDSYVLDGSVFSGAHTSGTGEWIVAPLFGWDYQHTKPADCLRVERVNSHGEANEEDSKRYAVEGSNILCDSDEVNLTYVFKEETTANWTQDFINAFALLLASYISQELSGPAGKAAELRTQFEKLIAPTAKQRDTRQGKGRVVPPIYDSDLVRARSGLSW